MASFDEHINQAKKNFLLFEFIFNNSNDYLDWCVTICFYVAVHIVNAHSAVKTNSHYRAHKDIENDLNPFNSTPCSVNRAVYTSYIKLSILSRRARYLLEENTTDDSIAHYIKEKHFDKSLKYLDCLLNYFDLEYSLKFPSISIKYKNLKKGELKFITKTP